VLKEYNAKLPDKGDCGMDELLLVRNLFSLVLCHYLHSVKGGWQQMEETVNFILMHFEEVCWESDYTLTLFILMMQECVYDSYSSLAIIVSIYHVIQVMILCRIFVVGWQFI